MKTQFLTGLLLTTLITWQAAAGCVLVNETNKRVSLSITTSRGHINSAPAGQGEKNPCHGNTDSAGALTCTFDPDDATIINATKASCKRNWHLHKEDCYEGNAIINGNGSNFNTGSGESCADILNSIGTPIIHYTRDEWQIVN